MTRYRSALREGALILCMYLTLCTFVASVVAVAAVVTVAVAVSGVRTSEFIRRPGKKRRKKRSGLWTSSVRRDIAATEIQDDEHPRTRTKIMKFIRGSVRGKEKVTLVGNQKMGVSVPPRLSLSLLRSRRNIFEIFFFL